MKEYIDCEVCAFYGEYDVDADYTCNNCKENLCFDHKKVWPQPKWENTKPIHYCKECYQYQWKVSA